MNNPATEQPSTRRVLLALGVLCAGFMLALWLAPMRVRPQPPIPAHAWRLEQILVNDKIELYPASFLIQFNDELNELRGQDGCNYFLFRARQDKMSGSLQGNLGMVTAQRCLTTHEQYIDGKLTQVTEKIDGIGRVIEHLDFYQIENEKLIFISFSGKRQFTFIPADQEAEAKVDHFPWGYTSNFDR